MEKVKVNKLQKGRKMLGLTEAKCGDFIRTTDGKDAIVAFINEDAMMPYGIVDSDGSGHTDMKRDWFEVQRGWNG